MDVVFTTLILSSEVNKLENLGTALLLLSSVFAQVVSRHKPLIYGYTLKLFGLGKKCEVIDYLD